MNLLDDYTLMGKFDVVFCRNVLIYFDEQTKADIVTRMGGVIQPGGFFFIGSTESMLGINTRFQGVPGCSGIYQLQPL
jgi:chemotaxis protein methyltransferase CheR